MTLPGADTCQPQLIPTPSGRRAWAHARSCRVYPGKVIGPTAPWHDGPPEATPTCTDEARACIPTVRYRDDARRSPLGLFHAETCPAHPGERIDLRTYARHRSWPPRGRLG